VAAQQQFPLFSRILHWTMAAMILAMLFIGIGMVAALADYHWPISIHKPLGIAILILVAIRLVNRLINPPPPLPPDLPALDRIAINASVRVLYFLMFALPLVGWGMLSAADYPIVLWSSLSLPPILPHNAELYAVLRSTAYHPRFSAVHDLHRSFQRRDDACLDLPRRHLRIDGVLEDDDQQDGAISGIKKRGGREFPGSQTPRPQAKTASRGNPRGPSISRY